MKKVNIIFFIINVILFLSVSVFAYSYLAQEVGFTPADSDNWDARNTKDALDDLRKDIPYHLSYDILLKQEKESSYQTSYIVKDEDTNYKALLIIMQCDNISVSVSPATCGISNSHLVSIWDADTMTHIEYGQYRTSSDLYAGYIHDIIPGDIINLNGYYSSRMLILGIK